MMVKNRNIQSYKGFSTVEASDLYQKLLECVQEGLILSPVTRDGSIGNFVMANGIFCEMSGYTPGELMKMSPVDLGLPEKQEEAASVAANMVKQRQMVIEKDLVKKDGSVIPVRIRTRLMEEFTGRGLVWVLHRASLAKYFEKIMVLRGGRIVEQGDHQRLLARGGEYSRLLARQVGAG